MNSDPRFGTEPSASPAEQQTLLELEHRYASIAVRYSHDLIALLDPSGNIQYASLAFRRVLGYTPAQLVGRSVFTLFHPADLTSLLEEWERLTADSTVEATCRAQHADGGWRWLQFALYSHGPTAQQVVVVAQDITERRKGDQQLARLLRHSELILNSITEGMIGTDLVGNITFVNAAAAQLLGWAPVELFGRPAFATLLQGHSNDELGGDQESPLAATARDGQVRRVSDSQFWRKDGLPIPVDFVCTPIVQEHAIGGVVVVFQDVSRRHELQAQFLQAQKMESMGRLAGSVAHDFNNLLTGIIGYANLAEMLLPPDSELRESLQEIGKSGFRAASLTRQLLAFARKQAVEQHPILLNDFVGELEKLLRRLLTVDISLDIRLDPDAGAIHGDPGQLSQVVINLVVNARDAMSNGGELVIKTSAVELRELDPQRPLHLPPGRYACLSVADNGMGMPPEIVAKIFEPFFTTKDAGAGTGLGLATCLGIVQQHRGAIAVASEVGSGTTFTVYIPQLDFAETVLPSLESEPAELGGSECVLVAEDDPSVRRLLCTLLRNAGYTVLEAADGEEALARAGEISGDIDLLLADIVMPRLRGTALARRLTAQRPLLRTLFISGQIDDEIVQHGQLLPGIEFLAKPFSRHDLLRKLRQVLDR